MKRQLTLLVALVLLLALPGQAQGIFSDGFESGSTCAWSSVESPDPCDGQDNDCDGATDEDALCTDGFDCTTDICDGVNGCRSDVQPDNCLIGGTCFDDGQAHPTNECQFCSAATNQVSWTNVPDGTPCSGGSGFQCVSGVCDLVCFAAGTMISTIDGMVPIELIQPGIRVPSYSASDGTISFGRVIAVDRRPSPSLVALRIGDEEILVTPDHSFALADGGWVAARELRNGDELFNLRSDHVAVSSVMPAGTKDSSTQWVFNLRIEGSGTYFVGRSNVLVHSCAAPAEVFVNRRLLIPVEKDASLGDGFPMVIHNALTPNLSLVKSKPTIATSPLPCFPVGRWSVLIGEVDGYLVLLDNEDHSIKLISTELLISIAEGEQACGDNADLFALVVPIENGDVGFGGVIERDRMYLSFFATRRVDVFRWAHQTEDSVPRVVLEQTITIEPNDRPGLSSVAIWDDRLWAADVNWICDTPRCTDRFGLSRLFVVDHTAASPSATPVKRSSRANAGGLYLHEPTDSLYLIGAGNTSSGRPMVQRIGLKEPDGAPILLPQGATVERGYPITDGVFAVLQLSGHHVFFIDAETDRLLSVQRFDGEHFHRLPPTADELPERSDAVLRQILADPSNPGRFYIVDTKGEQLVYVEFEASPTGFRALGRIPLGSTGESTAPNWAVSLR